MQQARPRAMSQLQRMQRSKHRSHHGLHRLVAVVPGSRWTCHVPDEINIKVKGMNHIVMHKRESARSIQMRNVLPITREQVVKADHAVPRRNQRVAQMRTKESGTTCNQ